MAGLLQAPKANGQRGLSSNLRRGCTIGRLVGVAVQGWVCSKGAVCRGDGQPRVYLIRPCGVCVFLVLLVSEEGLDCADMMCIFRALG